MRGWVRGGGSVLLVLLLSCTPLFRSPFRQQCKEISREFFRDQTKQEQLRAFSELSIEEQYEVYICGRHAVHPPAYHLMDPIGERGGAFVPLLRTKLDTASDDYTIHDIVFVLAFIDVEGTFDVGADKELMELIQLRIAGMQHEFWRRKTEGLLERLRR